MNDFINNVASEFIAMAIAFGFGFLTKSYLSIRKQKEVSNRLEESLPAHTAYWLLNYYFNRKRLQDLFLAEIGKVRTYIPLLTKEKWQFVKSEHELLSIPTSFIKSPVQVDEKIINERIKAGQQIWNAPMFCLNHIHETADSVRIEPGLCDFHQYISVCGALQKETLVNVKQERQRTKKRDAYAPDVNTISKCPMGAHGLGVQVALMYKDSTGVRILLQEREQSTAIYGGSIAVVPTFGCHPASAERASDEASIFHNFLREVYEEMYNKEDVMGREKEKHIDPKWFYSEHPIPELISLKQSGQLRFEILGFGFDALNGEANIAALALFRDEEFVQKEMKKMKINWEIKHVFTADIDSEELGNYLQEYKLQPGSAFAISLAIKRYKQLSSEGL